MLKRKLKTTLDFCSMLDRKVISSKKGFQGWCEYAIKNEWVKENE